MTSPVSPERFLKDVETTAAVLGAPYSEAVTARVIEAFTEHFATGAVLWKTTDRPGDSLSYRFYAAAPSDTVSLAVQQNLLDLENPLIPLVQSWSALYDGAPEQSCDFNAHSGLAKTWLYLGGSRPLSEVLSASGVPDTIRSHERSLNDLGLTHLRFAAVDYRHDTVNLYFRAPGPITADQCARIAALAGGEPPSAAQVAELAEFLPRNAYTLAVTISVRTGLVQRVCFYAPMLPVGRFPDLGERLSLFFSEAPSYDLEEANVAAWSFGGAGGTYRKGERGWFGDLAGTFRRWATFFSGDEQLDAALAQRRPRGGPPGSGMESPQRHPRKSQVRI